MKEKDIIKLKLSDLCLNTRTANCLINFFSKKYPNVTNIFNSITIQEVASTNVNDLLRIDNFSKKSLENLEQSLNQFGYHRFGNFWSRSNISALSNVEVTKDKINELKNSCRNQLENFLKEPHKFSLARLNSACSILIDDLAIYASNIINKEENL